MGSMKPKHAAAAALGSVQTVPVTALLAQVLLIAGLAATVSHSGTALSPAAWGVGIACGLITNAALSRGLSHYRTERLNPADWVTLVRATLTVGVAALIAGSFGHHVPVALLVTLAAVALALDAVDGWVARRTRSATLGAHFDAEVDAFLIFILSVYVARSVGAWVLAIGAGPVRVPRCRVAAALDASASSRHASGARSSPRSRGSCSSSPPPTSCRRPSRGPCSPSRWRCSPSPSAATSGGCGAIGRARSSPR